MNRNLSYIKFGLFLIALAFAVGMYVGIGRLTEHLKQNEKDKIILWLQAIESKSEVLAQTSALFDRIKLDEKAKVELWSDAMQLILTNNAHNNIDLLLKIISSNRNVPIVLVNDRNRIVSSVNMNVQESDTIFSDSLAQLFSKYPPMVIQEKGMPANYLYYQDSRLYKDLQFTLDTYLQSFVSDIVENSVSVPVIITDSLQSKVLLVGNVDSTIIDDSVKLRTVLYQMQKQNEPVEFHFAKEKNAYVFYEDSFLLRVLSYVPLSLTAVLFLFVLSAFLAFNASRKFDENRIWVGMSKETAHQLGTPISSLMAWVELLKLNDENRMAAEEINKDVARLEIIAERFSKIGSEPTLKLQPFNSEIMKTITYMRRRISGAVEWVVNIDSSETIQVPLNAPLMGWVIENLIRNAADAMSGRGTIKIDIAEREKKIAIDISDTGKGIAKRNFKRVFSPGFTTKKRGWGLGLALVKRIVEDYHGGKIAIKYSEIGKGTTFSILLPKA